MLEKVKVLLGIDRLDVGYDALLTTIIHLATEEARDITHNDNIKALEGAIIKMVVWQFNRIATEGLSAEGYNGATYTYEADYPEGILRALRSVRKVVVV